MGSKLSLKAYSNESPEEAVENLCDLLKETFGSYATIEVKENNDEKTCQYFAHLGEFTYQLFYKKYPYGPYLDEHYYRAKIYLNELYCANTSQTYFDKLDNIEPKHYKNMFKLHKLQNKLIKQRKKKRFSTKIGNRNLSNMKKHYTKMMD